MKKVIVVLVLMAILAPAALAATIVNDHFDDGVIGTNTLGIGTGFNAGYWSGGAAVTETGSTVTLENAEVAWSRTAIASKDGADMAYAATFEFNGISFSQSPNGWDWGGETDRLAIGVRGDSTAEDVDGGIATGFWIQFESDSLVTGSNSQFNGTSTLFYEAADDTKTVLATWTFDTLNWDDWADFANTVDFTPVLDITLDLDATGYALTIAGDTISNVTGALSDTFANAGITNELTGGYAFAFEQTENPSLFTTIDQVVITGEAVVPEPATLALLGLGSVLLRRKN